MKRWLGSLVALVVAAAPASADAAMTIGQTAPSATAAAGCAVGGATLFISTQSAAGSPSYAIPPGGGVITSWSAQGSAGAAGELKFKVVRDQLASYRIVGADPIQRAVPANTLAAFDVRIPVSGGDLIALWVPDTGGPCEYLGRAGDAVGYRGGSQPEPAIGADFVLDSTDVPFRTNVSAQLEPDADADGFGDETQDGCPDTPLRQDDCAPPGTEITKAPSNKSAKPRAQYKFTADEPDSTFECKLKGKGLKKSVERFGECASPRKYKNLDEGKFRFQVRAIDAAGNVDPTPAEDKFKVVG